MVDHKKMYSELGVSSKKQDVHDAIKDIDKGLFPGAFCKIVSDVMGRDDCCSIFHSDGVGTKSNLAYMYYKETGDISVFKGIVRDAIIMNIDDMLCVGATDKYFLSNNIARNSNRISGEIISTIIHEYKDYCSYLTDLGLPVEFCGGETADVGDIVKTLLIDASMLTTMKRGDVINASNIQENDIIIGFASYGKADYEDGFNSGIGSNGLTLARHGVLSHEYYDKYPECFDLDLDEKLIFFGNYLLTDRINDLELNIGKALLSPTRTYTPILLKVLAQYRNEIHGIIHNTGGGQIKVLNFGKNISYVKDNLFKLPKIFEIIQHSSETDWREMYQVFNMGHRLEIYCKEEISKELIKIANSFGVDAKVIGFCEKSAKKNRNSLRILSEYGSFQYE
jgi:phosphoribosylformylglycinamidine cyclo-ligase